jgi:hypothetical protein
MPSPDGSTVQVNEVLASAPLPSCAVTVTVLVPAVAGVPLIVPEPEIEVLGDRERAGQRQVRVGVAHLDAVAAGACRPAVAAGVPVLEVLLGQQEADRLAGAGLQADASEAFELAGRLSSWSPARR